MLLLRVKCPRLAGWKRTFSRASLAFFVIDSLFKTGYSGEIEPAQKFAGEVFENLEMAFDFLAVGRSWLWHKNGVHPGVT